MPRRLDDDYPLCPSVVVELLIHRHLQFQRRERTKKGPT
ncbi:hypothetical protein SynROS8604_02330 [Synechococcus sp. ROS8604]|nr:hypothetical protein SynROS8604_02330 [Synechococcus sp. ROS8604]